MTVLALDTATDHLSVALRTDSGEVIQERFAEPRVHARALIPAIDRIIQAAGVGLGDLTQVRVVDGPGSFTGLRVGASVLKALFGGTDVECASASSLLLIAAGDSTPGVVLSTLSARRSEFYAAWYDFRSDGSVKEVAPPSLTDWKTLGTLGRRPDRVVIGHPSPHGSPTGCEPPSDQQLWEVTPWQPGAAIEAAGLLMLDRWKGALCPIVSINNWEPYYGQAPLAQVRWEEEHGRALPDSRSDLR